MPYKDKAKQKEAARRSAEKHRESDKVRLARAYAEDREMVKARSQEWRKNNRPQMLQKLRDYRQANYPKVMLNAARFRAKKQNVPFDLAEEDIVLPDCCPVLGIEFERGDGKWASGSPSLDRMIPELGYVKGNVRVISWRANNLKSDGTAEEFDRIAAYIRGEL